MTFESENNNTLEDEDLSEEQWMKMNNASEDDYLDFLDSKDEEKERLN